MTEPAAEVKETKVKKERKSKGEKRSSKSGKKSRKSDPAGTESIPSMGVAKGGASATSELLELGLDEVPISSNETGTTFKLLAEDENLKLVSTCISLYVFILHSLMISKPIQCTTMESLFLLYSSKELIVFDNGYSFPHSNKSSLQLTSLDFNVLDSLNAKLERPV